MRPPTVVALLLAAAVGALLPGAAGALDLAGGRLKLTLYEGIGRFSLSCLTKDQGGTALPLLAPQDPRTTTLSIVVGNKVYRMGESAGFSEKAEKIAGGGRFTWKSSFLQVTETFTFIASAGSTATDGVRIDVGLKNLSERDANIGVRFLFDTYLGESSQVHFRTDTLQQLTHELTLTPADKALYWVSPLAGDAEDMGLQVMVGAPGVTVPDRVVFANWKRLSDASWGYDTSASRNFSLLPYSVNDSAVSQYYDPRPVAKGAETTVTLALGKFNRSGFGLGAPAAGEAPEAAGEEPEASEPAEPAAASVPSAQVAPPAAVTPSTSSAPRPQPSGAAVAPPSLDAQKLRADISAINGVLSKIDAALSSGTLSDDELAQLESILKELGSGAARYAPAAGK